MAFKLDPCPLCDGMIARIDLVTAATWVSPAPRLQISYPVPQEGSVARPKMALTGGRVFSSSPLRERGNRTFTKE